MLGNNHLERCPHFQKCSNPNVRCLIQTKAGNHLPVLKGSPSTRWTDHMARELEKKNLGRKRRGPDSSYNCHGLTLVAKLGWFGTRRCSSPSQIIQGNVEPVEAENADQHILQLLTENSYHRSTSRANILEDEPLRPPEVEVGDVVLYVARGQGPNRIDHSGIVVYVPQPPYAGTTPATDPVRVLSKFGRAGEYVHPYQQIPDTYGRGVEVWTDREV